MIGHALLRSSLRGRIPPHTLTAGSLTILCLFILATVARARCDDVVNEHRVGKSDLIAVGVIDRIEYSNDGDEWGICASIDFHVEEVLKGNLTAGMNVTIHSPGGSLGNETFFLGDYLLSFYEVGNRVLVFLAFSKVTNSFEVVYHYFKLVDGRVVDAHNMDEPLILKSDLSENELKLRIKTYIDCTGPTELARRSDLAVVGTPGVGVVVDKERGIFQTSFVINEVLSGRVDGHSIVIVTRPADEVVLEANKKIAVFLKELASGSYELVGGPSGLHAIDGDTDLGSVSVEDLRKAVQKAGK